MIGVDTNVLLRHALDDDPIRSPLASEFLAVDGGTEPLVVNAIVLVEFVWTLMRREGFEKRRVLDALDVLAVSERVILPERPSILDAIAAWRDGRADFADYLIGGLNRAAGASTTMTFDTAAAAHGDFTLLR